MPHRVSHVALAAFAASILAACGGAGGRGAPGAVSLSTPAQVAFGVQPLGVPADTTIELVSTLSGTATLEPAAPAAPFGWKGGAFPGQGGTCKYSLAAGARCTLVVAFMPSQAGSATGTATVAWSEGERSGEVAVDLAGTGTAPAHLVATPADGLAFGTVAIGAAHTIEVTLTNDGASPATGLGAPLAAPFAWPGNAFGGGGTCGTTLAAGASCTLLVRYTPSREEVSTATLRLAHQTGAAAATLDLTLGGTGARRAALAATPAAAWDFGWIVPSGTPPTHVFTLTNTGGVAATDLRAVAGPPSAFDWASGAFPGGAATDACGDELAPGASCTAVVAFDPLAAGGYADALELAFDDGVGAAGLTLDLTGVAAAPAFLAWSDGPAYAFGTLATGTVAQHVFTLQNLGGLTATGLTPGALAAPFRWKGGAYPGTGGTCGATLAGLASCTAVVELAPAAAAPASATLSVGYHDGAVNRAADRALTGAGTTGAYVAWAEAPAFEFGELAFDASTSRTFTATNTGGAATTGLNVSSLPAGFELVSTTCPNPGTLAAGASCTVTIAFHPTRAVGDTSPAKAFAATLALAPYGNDPATGQQVALSGTGTANPALRFDGAASRDLGAVAVGASAAVTLTLRNTGAADATGLTLSGVAAPLSLQTTCGATLAPAATCTATVTFAPSAAGSASATLVANAAGGVQSPGVAVTGSAVPPAKLAVAQGTPVDLGAPVVGTAASLVVTIHNDGSLPATSMGAAAPAAPFRFAGGAYPGTGGTCAAVLGAGDACTLALELAPTQTAPATATLSVGYASGAGAATLPVPLSGRGTAPALLQFGDAPKYVFADTVVGATGHRTLVVSNAGGVAATAFSRTDPVAPFAITGGTCGATLGVGAQCALELAFAPVASGSFTSTARVAYHDGAAAASASLDVAGKGLTAATLAVTALGDWGSVVVGAATAGAVTLRNDGQVSATGLGAVLSGPWRFTGGGAAPGQGGSCAATLAAGATCTLAVELAPGVAGPATGSLTVSWNDGVTAKQVVRDLTGKGLRPARLALLAAPVDFGTVAVGTTVTRIVTIVNDGEWPAAIQSDGGGAGGPFGYAGGAFPGTGGSCEASVPAGVSCRVVVAFTPAAAATVTGAIALGYATGAGQDSSRIDLAGTGTDRAHLQVTDWPLAYYVSYGLPPDAGPFDFGLVGAGKTAGHAFFVTNTGQGEAQLEGGAGLSGPFAFPGGAFPGAGGTCAATLAPGASCTVVVTFAPQGATSATQTFSIAYSDQAGAQPAATRGVTGAGTLGAAVAVYDFEGGVRIGPAWDFGEIGVAGGESAKELYVTNEGAATALDLRAAALPAGFGFVGGAFPGAGGSCLPGGSLAPGETCVLVVAFRPVAAGLVKADLTVQWTDGGTPGSTVRPLRGVGITTALLLVQRDGPAVLDLGVVGVGRPPRTMTLEVRNVGAATATGLVPTALATPFSYVAPQNGLSACGDTLAAGATCGLGIAFEPAAAGRADALPGFAYSDGVRARTASHALSGTGTAGASLSIRDWSDEGGFDVRVTPYDFGTVGQVASHTFTVVNDGAVAAQGIDVSPVAPPFARTTDCAATLAAGASCTVTVTFTPGADGAAGDTIVVAYDAGGGIAAEARRELNAFATTAPLLKIAECTDCGDRDGRPIDFGTSGFPTDRTLYVLNVGGAAASGVAGAVDGAAFSFAGGSYPGVGGQGWSTPPCGTDLPKGEACLITLRFTPAGSGPLAGRVTMTWSGGGAARQGVAGIAIDTALVQIRDWPDYAPGPWSGPYDFGVAGTPVAKAFTVFNAGTRAAALGVTALPAGFAFTGGGAYPGATGTCAATLASGASCTVEVVFQPSGTSTASGLFTLAYGDGAGGNAVASRAITGTGTDRAMVWLLDYRDQQPSSYDRPPSDFGIVGQTSSRTFYLFNTGAQDAQLVVGVTGQGYGLVSSPAWEGEPPECGPALAAGARCRVSVEFTPPALPGPYDGTLSVSFADGLGAAGGVSRQLHAESTDQPVLTIMDGSWGGPDKAFDFGTTAQPKTAAFIVMNTGGGDAALDPVSIGPSAYRFPGGAFPGVGAVPGGYPPLCAATAVAKGASCTFLVEFEPAGVAPGVPLQGSVSVPYAAFGGTRQATRSFVATAQ